MDRTTPKVGVAQTRAAIIERDSSSGTARRIRFVASDETVDRYGDIIRASGWQLDAYRKNPVLLYAHQSRELPIGRVEPVTIEGTQLVAEAQFMPEGMSAFADTVWQMADAKFLNAVSVGFMPTVEPNVMRGEPDKNGYAPIIGFEFVGQELLELSVVPVPANPNALQLAKSFALTADEMRCLFDVAPAAAIAAARDRTITLARLGRHRAAQTATR